MKTFLCISVLLMAFLAVVPNSQASSRAAKKIVMSESALRKAFPEMPRFDSRSSRPVLMRYKFKNGETVRMTMDLVMDNSIWLMERKADMHMLISMAAEYTVKSVAENGDAWADFTITRMTMKAASPESPGGITFDSDKEQQGADPKLAALKILVKTTIPVKVSSIGKILDMDLDPIHEAVARAGEAAAMLDFGKTADKAMKSSFTQLSLKPVKPGDIYEAGTIVEKLENLGEMSLTARYRVLAVSGDGQRVLLQPLGKMSLKPVSENSGTMKMSMDKGNVDGWLLFDVEKGNIVRSAAASCMDLSMSQDNVTMKMITDTKIRCENLEWKQGNPGR
jgi:hypothetical protein